MTEQTPPELRVRVLGELALERDGIPLELPSGRPARALLGLLALEHRLHARGDLAARLWPDVRDDSARTSLRGALAAVRRALEPGAERWLVATRDSVGLSPEVWSDASAFAEHVTGERLDDATALWRGEVLAGLDEEWVLTARDAWRERVAGVLARRADAAEAAGDSVTAIAHTRRIVELDPLGEAAQRLLIRRLARAGDRAAALAAYGRYAERLRSELQVAPSRETRELVAQLRAEEDAPSAPEPPAPAPASTQASGTVTLLFTDLVGSTELLVALGDDEAERLRRVHFGLLRDVAVAHAGHEVKSLGDGLMVVFGSSLDAVHCAVGIQQAVDRHNRRAQSASLQVRVGLNVGEPIRDEGDYFGTPVVVAKRLCDRAEGGQILAADLVRLLIGDRGGFTFRPVGELDLKGLGRPVTTCEVGWEPAAEVTVALPPDVAREQGALVGRTTELAGLEATWRRARGGEAVVVGIAGEAGIGKTRLVTELCRRAHAEGATVMLGRCHEETLVPYEPFVEALRQYVTACPPDELGLQVGTRRRVLAKLVPELDVAGPGVGDTADAGVGGEEGERYALFDAVGSFLREAAATRPTVLVLDDVHWADDASLLLLRAVARAATDVPLLIVATYRDVEMREDGPLAAALAQLRRARALESVTVKGLGADEVAALIRGRGGDLPAAQVQAVAARTDGNPFFVEEIVRHLDAGDAGAVPDSIRDLLRRRLHRLGESAQRTLSAAAVLGAEFDVDVLEQVVGGDADEVIASVEAALAEHVLVDVPDTVGRFAFAHALIRETIDGQLSPARRPGLHLRAGEALERRLAGRLDEHAARLAHHFASAGDRERALEYQLRAGRWAARVNAPETALLHFGAALETAARIGLAPAADERVRRALLERGWMRWLTADSEAGIADYGQALEAARTAGDRHLQAEALDHLAYAENDFDVAASVVHHAEALRIARELGELSLQIRILSRTAITRANGLDLAGALDAGEEARELAARTGSDRDMAFAVDALKLAALQLGDLGQLEVLTAELEEVERRHEDFWYLQWTLLESAFVPLGRARWDEASDRLGESTAINRRVGDPFARPLIHDATCWLQRSRGDLRASLLAGREAVATADRAGAVAFGAWTRTTLAWTLLDARAADQAIPLLEAAFAAAPMLGTRFRAAGHLAWALALAGEPARAAEAADEAERAGAQLRVREGAAYLFGFGASACLARAHLDAGRPERGEAVLAPLLESAGRSGWHEATALLALVLGRCCLARGDEAAAHGHLREAVDRATTHGLPTVAWEALAALATVSPESEAAQLRARSAALVEGLADGVGDTDLTAGLLRVQG